jgi:hypothetical protein
VKEHRMKFVVDATQNSLLLTTLFGSLSVEIGLHVQALCVFMKFRKTEEKKTPEPAISLYRGV